MTHKSVSIIILVASRALARVIQLFGIYVIIHGHYSPGGGFQGGALLAAGVILMRMAYGREASQSEVSTGAAIPLASIGALLFAGTGLITLAFGGHYMDYGAVPVPGIEEPIVRYYGILLVEFGIGLAVMTVLVAIFDDMLSVPPEERVEGGAPDESSDPVPVERRNPMTR